MDPPPPPLPPPPAGEWADRRDPRPAAEERHVRRRRSAVRIPAFVDRMEVADDADGRVTIFSVDGIAEAGVEALASEVPEPSQPPADEPENVGVGVDGRYVAGAIAAVLVAVLVLGLLLLTR